VGNIKWDPAAVPGENNDPNQSLAGGMKPSFCVQLHSTECTIPAYIVYMYNAGVNLYTAPIHQYFKYSVMIFQEILNAVLKATEVYFFNNSIREGHMWSLQKY
jgi:hypothetical protein